MNKIFILDGAMRPAKTEIVLYLKNLSHTLHGNDLAKNILLSKFSDREYEPDETEDTQDFVFDLDLHNKVTNNPQEWISYVYAGKTYGIKVSSFEEAISGHENTFVILRNTELISELKTKYEGRGYKVIPIYVYSDKKAIDDFYRSRNSIVKAKLKTNQNGTKQVVSLQKRKERLEMSDSDYENAMSTSTGIYDEVLLFTRANAQGSASIRTKLYGIIKKYENIVNKNAIFLIHSFLDKAIADEFIGCVKTSAQENLGYPPAECTSMLYGAGSYLIGDTVFEAIENHDYIVCDITPDRCIDCKKRDCKQGVSPNIWIELGYAIAIMRKRRIAIGKRIIITCKCSIDKRVEIPTDIQGINIVFYPEFEGLKEQLVRHFKQLSK